MAKIVHTVKSKLGMHARPAGFIVDISKNCESVVELIKKDKKIEAKQIMAVLGLGIKYGDIITIEINGSDERDTAHNLQTVLDLFL